MQTRVDRKYVPHKKNEKRIKPPRSLGLRRRLTSPQDKLHDGGGAVSGLFRSLRYGRQLKEEREKRLKWEGGMGGTRRIREVEVPFLKESEEFAEVLEMGVIVV